MTLRTETEARQNWCYLVGVETAGTGAMLNTRGRSDIRGNMESLCCEASGCQAWRWHDPAAAGATRRGYCGAAGDPGPGDLATGGDLLQAKGDLVSHDGTDPARLPVGADGQILLADASQPLGLIWTPPSVQQRGDVATHNGSIPARLPVGQDGYQLAANSSRQLGIEWVPPPQAQDVLTTKGDIATHNGSSTLRLSVGSDGRVLTADASAAEGISWQAPAGGGFELSSRGDLLTHSGSAEIALPKGPTGSAIIATDNGPSGLQWVPSVVLFLGGTTSTFTLNASASKLVNFTNGAQLRWTDALDIDLSAGEITPPADAIYWLDVYVLGRWSSSTKEEDIYIELDRSGGPSAGRIHLDYITISTDKGDRRCKVSARLPGTFYQAETLSLYMSATSSFGTFTTERVSFSLSYEGSIDDLITP